MHAQHYDGYWHLDSYKGTTSDHLRTLPVEKESKPKQSDSKRRLVELAHEADCGCVAYDSCNNTELLQFAQARHIVLRRATRKDTIIELTKADSSRTFKRFLDLPPELRNRVYQFYIGHSAECIGLPTVPPLARTSKQLMQEVDPLFLATKTIRLVFEDKGTATRLPPKEIKPSPRTRLFLVDRMKNKVSEIRSFEIEVRSWWRKTNGGED